ncbi:MAG: complex I NDUFA9 subunit family protein [Micropepsaceae bacterium]
MQQANSAKLITIFGGTGFVGRQVVRRMAQAGYRLRVVSRKPSIHVEVKPLGDVGQIALVRADIRNEAQVREAVAGATFVVNLVGILRPGGGQSFDDVHAEGSGNIARACLAASVSRLVQFSAIGADTNSKSSYARSRAAGEVAARQAFPNTTVLRPSIIFGNGDGFFNLFAGLMRMSRLIFPVFGAGVTKFQPVYVGDVAEAVAKVLGNDRTRGKTYELGGPAIYTFRQILEMVARCTGRKLKLISIPFFLLDIGAALTGWLPFAPVTLDQARLLKKDNVVKGGTDAAQVGTLADLGITPTTVEAVVPSYLYAFRSNGQYAETHEA